LASLAFLAFLAFWSFWPFWPVFPNHFRSHWTKPGANPTSVSYNDGVVKIYNATSGLERFNNKYSFSSLKKRTSCKFGSQSYDLLNLHTYTASAVAVHSRLERFQSR
jgi:hypothetical protein